MMNATECRARLRLSGRAGCERVAMAAASAAGRCAGLLPARLADIETAVAEACLNGLEHGASGQSGGSVDLTFGVCQGSFRVVVRDGGRGFDPAAVDEPSIAGALAGGGCERGWGLFLMRRLADKVDVQVGRTGCAVELHFSLTSEVS